MHKVLLSLLTSVSLAVTATSAFAMNRDDSFSSFHSSTPVTLKLQEENMEP